MCWNNRERLWMALYATKGGWTFQGGAFFLERGDYSTYTFLEIYVWPFILHLNTFDFLFVVFWCSMVLQQIFCRFTGSAAQTHCARHPQLVSKKFLEEEIFAGTNFRKLAFDRENRENFYLAKISRYTVFNFLSWSSGHTKSNVSKLSRDVTHFLHNVVITNFETNGLP